MSTESIQMRALRFILHVLEDRGETTGRAYLFVKEALEAPQPEEQRITATRVELSNKARRIIMEMQHTYGVPASLLDELRELDHQFHACEPQKDADGN